MIAPQISVRWEGFQKDRGRVVDKLKLWNEDTLRDTQKLLTLATTVVMQVKSRVLYKGLDAKGSKFLPLGKKARVAIPPWYPQPRSPDRFRYHGALNPYAMYQSRETYMEARKLPKFRNFFMSGGMWKGLQAKAVGPGHVRVMFAGSSPRWRVTKSFFGRQKQAIEEGKKVPRKQTMQNRKKASGSARIYGDLLAFNRKEKELFLELMGEFLGAVVLTDWQKDRQAFRLKQLQAKVDKINNNSWRKIKKIMNQAGPGTGKEWPGLGGSRSKAKI